MKSSMCRVDAATHLKIIATALLGASTMVWVGIGARISAPSIAASVTELTRPSTVPVELSPAPAEPSITAMIGGLTL